MENIRSNFIPQVIYNNGEFINILFFKQKNEDIMELLLSTKIFKNEVLIYAKFVIIRSGSKSPVLQLFHISRWNVNFGDDNSLDIDKKDWILIEDFDNIFVETVSDAVNHPLLVIGYDLFETIIYSSAYKDKEIEEIIQAQLKEYIRRFVDINISTDKGIKIQTEPEEEVISEQDKLLARLKYIVENNFFHYLQMNTYNKNIFKKNKIDKNLKELKIQILEKAEKLFNEYYESALNELE